jgi:hypothetical protein
VLNGWVATSKSTRLSLVKIIEAAAIALVVAAVDDATKA